MFRQPYPALTNGGVVYAVVPGRTWRQLFYSVGPTDDWSSIELECATTPPVRDDAAQHLVREGKRKFEGQIASGAIKIQQ